MKNIRLLLVVLCGAFLLTQIAYAQDEQSDLEKAAQNPIASMISLPFQDNIDFDVGEDNRVKNTLNIQPVVPLSLGPKFNLVVRTIIPIISQPTRDSDGSQSTTFGLGDITLTAFLTSTQVRKLIWGIGPVIGIPTATDEVLGVKEWTAGPSLILLTQPTGWTVGCIVQNTWSLGNNSDNPDVNFFYSQVFVTKNLKAGWYINSAPIITANWEADAGDQWSVPIGAGAGRVFHIGNMPVNAQVGYYNYVVTHHNGADWQLRFQLSLLFPKGS
jgi:hypothetical protein